MGKPGRLIISHYHEPVSPCAYNGGSDTGWLQTYCVTHATSWNSILGLEEQVLWSDHTAPLKELNQKTGLISKTFHRRVALRGYITSPIRHQTLGKLKDDLSCMLWELLYLESLVASWARSRGRSSLQC